MSAAERIGAQAQARLAGRVREALAALPGIEANIEGDAVVLTGRRLERRALSDPALRWIGGLLQ